MKNKQVTIVILKCSVFLFSLLPFMGMIADIVTNNLGANPVETLSNRSGIWALRFLLLTLACSPVHLILKNTHALKYRRMLGLFTFFYSSLHFAVFIVLEHSFTWSFIVEAIQINPAVSIGLLMYLLLLPMALTSSRMMHSKLGKKWQRLHNSIYVIALLSILHLVLTEKADIKQPLFYGILLLISLSIRGIYRNRKRQRKKITAYVIKDNRRNKLFIL